MSLTLGMDTGGTYTDGVVLDRAEHAVLCKAKAPTTPDDLVVGIRNCIEALQFSRMEEITLVALSTTLATNAVVEGRGARVGLLLMGDTDMEFLAEEVRCLSARYNIMGTEVTPLDMNEVRAAAESMRGKVEAVAISGYASVRNPKHESLIAHTVRELLDVPVVCAHHLSSALGFDHRTVTAVLNARLIPVIKSLLEATRSVLREYGIDAPIMVVKGDGTLMPEQETLTRPIETVLSGPAASMIGASFLTRCEDALVLDMGGTTTDIANIEEGAVRIRLEGARVGGWSTRVRAAEISTFGIGGDSRICLDTRGKLRIGPQRVLPLCVLAAQHPHISGELRSFTWHGDMKTYREQEADCYIFAAEPDGHRVLTAQEEIILAELRKAPHSVTYLARAAGTDPERIDATRLLEDGVITRSSVTPTDLLHAMGRYNQWNAVAATAGANILAKRLEIPLGAFLKEAAEQVVDKLAMALLQSTVDFEGAELQYEDDGAGAYLLHGALRPRPGALLRIGLSVPKPIVAIGAPVRAWLEDVGKKIGAQIIIPEHEDVANAIGAAVGQVVEKFTMLISYDDKRRCYILNAPWARSEYRTLEEAKFYAIHEGRKYAEHSLARAGCEHFKVKDTTHDMTHLISDSGDTAYSGTRVEIVGTGAPHTLSRKEDRAGGASADKSRFFVDPNTLYPSSLI